MSQILSAWIPQVMLFAKYLMRENMPFYYEILFSFCYEILSLAFKNFEAGVVEMEKF